MPVSHNLENPYLIGESEELFLSKCCSSPARVTYNVGWTGSSDGSSLDVREMLRGLGCRSSISSATPETP